MRKTIEKIFEAIIKILTLISLLLAAFIIIFIFKESVMMLPYMISTCSEAMEKAYRDYSEHSSALGVSKSYMIRHIILPGSRRSILAGTVLALGRGMGETMAVMMVIGNAPLMPRLLKKTQTIPSLIALEMGMAEVGSLHYHALGVSKAHTILRLILPLCRAEIISIITMAGGFAMGAAAPIILTAAVIFAPIPKSLSAPVMALPFHLYMLTGEGISLEKAYGTALVLIIILLMMNIISATMNRRKDR